MGTCATCGATCVQVIGPVGLATCFDCRHRQTERHARIVPLIDKVIGQYQRGLITPDEFVAALIEVTG
jgi:hypothetical protein